MDLTSRKTETTGGGWVDTVNDVADTVNSFLQMKNKLAEKKQEREMRDLQMQQIRQNMFKDQQAIQEQEALQNDIKSLPTTKRVPKTPEELLAEHPDNDLEGIKSLYTPEKFAEIATKEVPKSMIEKVDDIAAIHFKHNLAKMNPAQLAQYRNSLIGKQNASVMDARYDNINTRLEMGDMVAPEEVAWAAAYEKRKTLAPRAYGEQRLTIMRETPQAVYDNVDGQFKYVKKGMATNPRYAPPATGEGAEKTSAARQRGGPMAAQINAANDLYQENLPKVIALRNIVAQKGLLPDSPLTDINALNQWLQAKYSDPDLVELQGKVKLMADNLQKTIGGGQGGEWAFKVADTLLNPTYQGAAFERRMRSHGQDLVTLSKSRRNFGKTPVTESTPIKKKSPLPFKVLFGRAQAANPSMTPTEIEKNLRDKYEFTE